MHVDAQNRDTVIVNFTADSTYQTIQNFGASDAWSAQFVGNWPDAKKNAIADLLFSMDTSPEGNPKGIGLSLWRYNIGAGSAEQKDKSGIKDEWRRAALTTGNDIKVKAQNWFLQAAQKRGVKQFLGFMNSPPVMFTKNNRAFADKGICNLDSSQYAAFANYTVQAIQQIKKQTGISLNYISPINEPQWNWSDGGQEGCPYSNVEVASVIKAFNNALQRKSIRTKLLITESGNLKYLLPADDKQDKDNQVNDFFSASSPLYVGNLSNITNAIAAHSYFTTSPFDKAMALRSAIKGTIAKNKSLEYWQSEYCILGDNAGEINGEKRDLGMDAALYLAKVLYVDLVYANASAWQWWLAISPYNYKDGLIYIDKNETDGNYYDSKMLWAFGNYSRFVRPGMKRIKLNTNAAELYASGFIDEGKRTTVLVFVNASENERPIKLTGNLTTTNKTITTYTTNTTKNLEKKLITVNNLTIPAKSVVTLLYEQ